MKPVSQRLPAQSPGVVTVGRVTPADLLRAAVVADAARPLVTYYDDATGERVELSAATFDNWVAKTANLLQDGLAASPGTRVAVHLPLHWQTVVWHFACWSVGALVVPNGNPDAADVVVTGPDQLDRAAGARGADVVALSLRPLGGPFAAPLPRGVLDYGADVAGFADRFSPYAPVPADSVALDIDGVRLDPAGVAAAAEQAATRWGLRLGARTLTTAPPDTLDGLLAALPAALCRGGSVVLCRNLERRSLVARMEAERVTTLVDGAADRVSEFPEPSGGR